MKMRKFSLLIKCTYFQLKKFDLVRSNFITFCMLFPILKQSCSCIICVCKNATFDSLKMETIESDDI